MRFNRLFFWFFYRFRTPPWEGHPIPKRLNELIESPSPLPCGKALDVGCGTGDTAIYLAQHGWEVTAFDFVRAALGKSSREGRGGWRIDSFFHADVTNVKAADVGTGFHLIVDNGLLHGLTDDGRQSYTRVVSAAAANAILLIAAFAEKQRRGPRGIDGTEVERRFGADWALVGHSQDPAMSRRPDDPIYMHELRRR